MKIHQDGHLDATSADIDRRALALNQLVAGFAVKGLISNY
jgi:hypothetical protein